MNLKILLITGWGGGTKLLEPLKHSLESEDYNVELINIFNALDHQVLQEKVEWAKSFDAIIGWSLGGQLATLLVDEIAKQYAQHKVLITLGSNPCFVANDEWSTAMQPSTFESFKASFNHDAISTLKKFGYMVCEGTSTTKQDFIKLQSFIQPQNLETLLNGLNCLEKLNNVSILRKYEGYQLHVFSKQDYLVNYKVARNIQKIPAKFLNVELMGGSHGFPLFDFELVSGKISQYLNKIKQINS